MARKWCQTKMKKMTKTTTDTVSVNVSVHTVAVNDADSGDLVRDYERVPDELSDASLKRIGFLR